jgi:hypothetical protein
MKDFLDFFAFRQVPDGGYAKRAFASTDPAARLHSIQRLPAWLMKGAPQSQ